MYAFSLEDPMKQNALLWTVKQIRRRIPALVLLVLAQVGHSLFLVLFALGSRGVIDSAVAGDPNLFAKACNQQALIIGGILLCLTLARHLREKLSADLERDWKQSLLRGLLYGDYAEVSAYHSAELLNRMNADVSKVNDGILTILPGATSMVTRLAAAVVVLGTLDWKFTLMAATLGAVVICATGLMRRKLKELNKQVSQHDGKVSGYIQESMEKLLLIQAMDVSAEVELRADRLLQERYNLQRKRKNISLLANSSVSILRYGAGFLALWWCAGRLLEGQMSFGSLTAVIQLVNQLQAPFVNLSGVFPKYMAMIASAERLQELQTIPGQQAPVDMEPERLYEKTRSLRMKDLTFSYDREVLLQDASFTLPRDAFAVITGPSGVGKSTILKLLLGIYHPEKGSLELDCGAEKVLLDRSTRRLFAYVPQGNMLFSGTIRENLTIACPEATEQQLSQAVSVSCMDAFLDTLPQGLETQLGENGAGLSEGQAQRIAIARAVLSGAPILLLDECTSALDEATEAAVLQNLKALPNRTCIAVTHRPAALALSQWHLEVRDGSIFVIEK